MTTPSERPPPRRFVGRESEMQALRAGLDDACAARGGVILLVGEPGIGKTRTAEELASHARARGAQVLVGRCYEGEGAPPYWPWVELVRAYARQADPAALRADLGHGAADVARVIEELRGAEPEVAAPTLGAEQARFRFFDALTAFLKSAARRRPLLLILDDLHRADPSSLLLLQFLAREIADAPLLLVGTYRDVDIDRRHPLVDALGELARQPSSRVIALSGLSPADVAAFMQGEGAAAPPPAAVAEVYRRSAGNPFFVGQLIRLLAPEGDWSSAADAAAAALPAGVQEVIAARLDRLSPACRRLLHVAAVMGRQFDLRDVAVAEQGGSVPAGVEVEPYLAALEQALQQRMVRAVPGAIFEYVFAHALIRDALYAELGPRERMRVHRAIGEALEARLSSAADPPLAALAHHFCETMAGGGDVAKAVAYARRAADHAKARLAYEEAARCYELALRALSGERDERQQCEVLLALGEAHHLATDEAAARDAHRRSAELARRLGEPELLARAALGFAGVVIGVEVDRQVIAVLEEALGALPVQRGGLRAMLLARLAMELYLSPDAQRRDAISAEAVDTARACGDQRALTVALEARQFAVWQRLGPRGRLQLADEMVRLSSATGDAETLMRGHHLRLTNLLELGRLDAVDAALADYARLADELRPPSHRWGLGLCRAMRAMMDGRFADAEALAGAALTVGQSVQPETAANFFAAQVFFIRREQGRLAELEDALIGAVAAYPSVPGWRSVLGSLYVELERRDAAARELEHAAAHDFDDIAEDANWLAAMTFLGEISAFLGDRARAALVYERLLPHAELVVVAGIASACNGAVARVLGLLAAALGRGDESIAHFERALAINRRLAAPAFVVRTQQEYAAVLLGLGAAAPPDAAPSAGRLLEAALAGARKLGMDGIAAKAGALLATLADAAPAATLAVAEADNVFRRDDDHWTLMFEGRGCRLKDAKGLAYIAMLLREPDRPFHVSELLGELPASSRERLRDLADELEEAERFNDAGRAERVRAAIDQLAGALPSNADSDLLRLRVTKAIRAATSKIDRSHPALGHHLRTTIRTGSICTYVPDPTKKIRWSA